MSVSRSPGRVLPCHQRHHGVLKSHSARMRGVKWVVANPNQREGHAGRCGLMRWPGRLQYLSFRRVAGRWLCTACGVWTQPTAQLPSAHDAPTAETHRLRRRNYPRRVEARNPQSNPEFCPIVSTSAPITDHFAAPAPNDDPWRTSAVIRRKIRLPQLSGHKSILHFATPAREVDRGLYSFSRCHPVNTNRVARLALLGKVKITGSSRPIRHTPDWRLLSVTELVDGDSGCLALFQCLRKGCRFHFECSKRRFVAAVLLIEQAHCIANLLPGLATASSRSTTMAPCTSAFNLRRAA